jgi:hypothetical protein
LIIERKLQMHANRLTVTVFLLGAALAFGTPAMSADLPKEGTYSGTYAAFGTNKAAPIGKDRLLVTFEENGLTLSNGFSDHMTWHCFGSADFVNGMGQTLGYCEATDPVGDQVAGTFADEKHAPDKYPSGVFTFTTGTGKFAGISGSLTYVPHGYEFRTAVEGTYVSSNTYQGNYKLP